MRWVWYAARRAELRLDGQEDDFASAERLEKSMRIIAPTLRLNHTDHQQMLSEVRLTRYGADEAIQFPGQVPKRMTFIVNGRVRLIARGEDGALIPVRTLEEGDFLGSTALTREPVTTGAYALDEVTVLQIERAAHRGTGGAKAAAAAGDRPHHRGAAERGPARARGRERVGVG